jgi:membrane-bound lytic murein transglycosylase D
MFLCLSGCAPQKPVAVDNSGTSTAKNPETSSDNQTETIESDDDELVSDEEIISETPPVTAKLPYPHNSLWPIITDQYQLNNRAPGKILKNDLAWFKRNSKFIRQSAHNSRRYLYYISGELASRNMPGEIALLPMIESNYKPTTRAARGHEGLWQFARGTGKRMGLEYNWWYNGSYDVVASTDAALDYIEKLAKRYDGDWLLAMAAYNCGSGTLDKIISSNRSINPHREFWRLPLPAHTRDHLKRLLALSTIIANPARYGIELPEIENREYFYAVTLEKPVDMVTLAHLSKTSLSEIQQLNTGFLRPTTDPLKMRRVLLPIDSPKNIPQQLAALSEAERFNWPRHQISTNDSLAKIARRYGTTVVTLRQINGLTSSSKLRANKTLLVPSATTRYENIASSTSSKKKKKVTAAKGDTHHRVASGESLWTIAKQYEVSVNQLMKWNQLKEGQVLKIGQKLRVRRD